MRRLILAGGAIGLLVVVGVVSQSRSNAPATPADPNGLTIKVEDKNPWTGLQLNNDPEQFQFAVVSDRTGGHRANIFSKAVYQVNLLQPTFVMSVGDLIEGYSIKPEVLTEEWNEFDSYSKKFQMPFFYIGGNHDLANRVEAATWEERYGRKNYHFVYKNVLFMALNSEDGAATTVGPEQRAYVAKTLAENSGVRWTFVFVHKPLWLGKDLEKNGWAEVEKQLAGRKYSVFCGHVHRYQKFIRNGMNYYQLATTGGGSRMRGVPYGEFDHVAWITVKKDAPLITNILLDGILPDNLKLPEVSEPGVPIKNRKATYPVNGLLTLDGKPVAGATVRFMGKSLTTGKYSSVADGLTDEMGRFQLSYYGRFDGCPAGEYVVAVVKTAAGFDAGEAGAEPMSLLPEEYASAKTTPLRATVKEEATDVKLELKGK